MALRRRTRILTTENNRYLRKIEELANAMLSFFREKEKLREEQAIMSNAMQSTGKRPRSMSAAVELQDDHKRKKKKRKIPNKAVRTPVVINEVTERLKEFVANEIKGTDMKLVIQKTLYKSDTLKSQNRLNMPVNQLETDEFLTEEEKRILNKSSGKENMVEVALVGPTLEMYKMKMELTMWHMETTKNYVLKTHWHQFWLDHERYLEEGSKIQVWSFRKDH